MATNIIGSTELKTANNDSVTDDTYDAVVVLPDAYATDDSAMPATPLMFPVGGEYRASPTTYTDGDATVDQSDVNGNKKVAEQYMPVYEDNTIGVAKVEHRYSYGRVTADGQVKSGAGLIHTISIAGLTATPTAGLVTVYDSLTETGTVVYAEWVFATVVGHTITLDVSVSTGIYVGFDATLANAQITVAYR